MTRFGRRCTKLRGSIRTGIVGAALLVGTSGCLWPGPFKTEAARGRVVIDVTGEPIAGVLITQKYFDQTSDAPSTLFYERSASSDADGRFELASKLAPSLRMWLLWTTSPSLSATYPGVGELRPTRDSTTGEWSIRFQIIDPEDPQQTFANGRRMYEGVVDHRGKPTGHWVFYREDGSELARGEYYHGHRVGRWDWFDREGHLVETRGCPFRNDPRFSASFRSIDGGVFHVPPPYPTKPCPQKERQVRDDGSTEH